MTNLAERLKRDITPVAMTADLYTAGTKYKPDDLDDSKRVAEKMVTDGLPALQGLAQAIADADRPRLRARNPLRQGPPGTRRAALSHRALTEAEVTARLGREHTIGQIGAVRHNRAVLCCPGVRRAGRLRLGTVRLDAWGKPLRRAFRISNEDVEHPD